jgi:hypothetical protein
VAYVSFLRDGKNALETQPSIATPASDNRLGMAAFHFSIPLTTLAPGEYDCQVTVIDPTGRKSTFWQAPIKVIP